MAMAISDHKMFESVVIELRLFRKALREGSITSEFEAGELRGYEFAIDELLNAQHTLYSLSRDMRRLTIGKLDMEFYAGIDEAHDVVMSLIERLVGEDW